MIEVRIRGVEVASKKLARYTKFPKQVNKGANKWGRRLAGNMKMAVNPHNWTGKLHNSIRWEPKRYGGNLFMYQYGLALDRAPPHKVSLNKNLARNIKLAEWAVAHKIAEVRGNRVIPGAIWVRPHPFIDRTVQKALPKLLPYIMNEIKRGVGK